MHFGGEGGIRTLVGITTPAAFQAEALGHYATSPNESVVYQEKWPVVMVL